MRKWQKYSTLALTTSMMVLATLGGDVNLSFANSVDTKAPVIETVNTVTIDTVELVLKDEGGFDMISLWDKSNYDIEGKTQVLNVLTVKIDTSGTLATVVLKTSKFEKVESLFLYIKNIKDSSGNKMDKTSYLILSDLSPSIMTTYSYKDIVFYGSGKNEVTVIYNRADELDMSSIKNINNYSSSELIFSSINVTSDTSRNRAVVVLSTIENLIESSQYHLFLNKVTLKDGEICEPILKSDYISGFNTDSNKVVTNNQPAKSEDNKSPEIKKDGNKTSTSNDFTPPKVKKIRGKTPTSMELVFYDSSGFNMDTLKQKGNYNLQSTVEVQEIESVTLNASGDTATVILKTDKFTNSMSQKIKLTNIKDSFGNEIEEQAYSFGPVTE